MGVGAKKVDAKVDAPGPAIIKCHECGSPVSTHRCRGGGARVRRGGGGVAEPHARFYGRRVLKRGGPMAVVGRAASLYRDYFQGGEMSIVERREQGGRVPLDDPHCPPQFCGETLLGFIEEL